MEWIIGAIVLYVAYIVIKAMGSGAGRSAVSRAARSCSSDNTGERVRDRGKQRVIEENEPWLRDRWRLAKAEQESGALKVFPKWYFDDPTDRQLARLEAEGINISSGASKGQVSDYIGLFVDPEPDELEMLKFFDVQLKGPMRNQTRARHEIALIEADPEKQRAWRTRPADPLQKEFYRFIGSKPPAGVTFEQAAGKMSETLHTLTEAQQDEWADIENMVEEFDDREFRADVEIRRPSAADVRSAMTALKSEGKDPTDPYAVADKLRDLKPSLAREAS